VRRRLREINQKAGVIVRRLVRQRSRWAETARTATAGADGLRCTEAKRVRTSSR
jgi:hypothetical protein